MGFVSCRECGNRVSKLAELCPDCGYPNSPAAISLHPETYTPDPAALREYRWMQVLGAVVVVAGIAAAVADSPLASVIAIAIGLGTFVIGFLVAWRHTSVNGK